MTDENTNPNENSSEIDDLEARIRQARSEIDQEGIETAAKQPKKRRLRPAHALWAMAMLVIYLLGLASGYGMWGMPTPEEKASHDQQTEMEQIMAQVSPPKGYTVPARFGDMGPKMAAAGVFDVTEFEQVYQQANQPLTTQQLSVLRDGSDNPVVFNKQNAYFLLNYFWAVGLSNKNPVLDSGPIWENSQGKVDGYASTGGWSLAKKPLLEIYSKLPLISLTGDQQKNLEEAAKAVYRPCCDNPTHFPDCNHGMAMLGLMELMASQNATVPQMMEAARYANAYWYPDQTVEQAIFFKKTTGKNYQDVDASLLLGRQYSSGSGFQGLHQYLSQNNLLPQAPKSGGSCGV